MDWNFTEYKRQGNYQRYREVRIGDVIQFEENYFSEGLFPVLIETRDDEKNFFTFLCSFNRYSLNGEEIDEDMFYSYVKKYGKPVVYFCCVFGGRQYNREKYKMSVIPFDELVDEKQYAQFFPYSNGNIFEKIFVWKKEWNKQNEKYIGCYFDFYEYGLYRMKQEYIEKTGIKTADDDWLFCDAKCFDENLTLGSIIPFDYNMFVNCRIAIICKTREDEESFLNYLKHQKDGRRVKYNGEYINEKSDIKPIINESRVKSIIYFCGCQNKYSGEWNYEPGEMNFMSFNTLTDTSNIPLFLHCINMPIFERLFIWKKDWQKKGNYKIGFFFDFYQWALWVIDKEKREKEGKEKLEMLEKEKERMRNFNPPSLSEFIRSRRIEKFEKEMGIDGLPNNTKQAWYIQAGMGLVTGDL